MLAGVKKCVDNNDVVGLRYIFRDCLDVDPTFENYKEDYEYCRKLPGFFELHEEMSPQRPHSMWNEDYWLTLKGDLRKNFSEKRFEHMREAAPVIFAEKVARLQAERQAAAKPSAPSHASIAPKPQNNEHALYQQKLKLQKEEQERQTEEKRRKLEAENRRYEAEKREREAAKNTQSSKKHPGAAAGIAVVILLIAAIIVILFLNKR